MNQPRTANGKFASSPSFATKSVGRMMSQKEYISELQKKLSKAKGIFERIECLAAANTILLSFLLGYLVAVTF